LQHFRGHDRVLADEARHHVQRTVGRGQFLRDPGLKIGWRRATAIRSGIQMSPCPPLNFWNRQIRC
jgi:hypothetical protein